MAYEDDRGSRSPLPPNSTRNLNGPRPVDPVQDPRPADLGTSHPAAPAQPSSNTGTIAIVLAIIALFLGVLFFGGGAEQAVVPEATLPTAETPADAPVPGASTGGAVTPPAAPIAPTPVQ